MSHPKPKYARYVVILNSIKHCEKKIIQARTHIDQAKLLNNTGNAEMTRKVEKTFTDHVVMKDMVHYLNKTFQVSHEKISKG